MSICTVPLYRSSSALSCSVPGSVDSGRACSPLFSPSSLSAISSCLQPIRSPWRWPLEAHQPFRGFVYGASAADGSAVFLSTSGPPLFGADGRFLGYRGVSSDVTALVRAEQVEKGLSISRSIIDSHRGRLWATANPDHGATFRLALPGMR